MLEGQQKTGFPLELLKMFSCANTRREFLHDSKLGEMAKVVDVACLEFKKTSFLTAFSWRSWLLMAEQSADLAVCWCS